MWLDIKQDIERCYDNSDIVLKGRKCSDRDWFAGKCAGISEVLGLEGQYK